MKIRRILCLVGVHLFDYERAKSLYTYDTPDYFCEEAECQCPICGKTIKKLIRYDKRQGR